MSTTIPERLYSYPEAAKRLGLSQATLRRWVSEGRIGFYKLGRVVRFSERHLSAVLEEHYAEGARDD